MALNSFNAYHSYLKSIEPLNDAERGRLFTALLEYSSTGIAPELRGNERYIFPTMKEQIDRDREKYEARCAQNSKNIGIRWNTNVYDRIRPNTNVSKDKDKDKDKDKERPLRGNGARGAQEQPDISDCGFSPELRAAVEDWLAYKRERRENYKPTGLKSLFTQVGKCAGEHGDEAVIAVIRQSMSSNYQGITFDRLKKGGAPPDGTVRTSGESPKPKRSWGTVCDV